MAITAADVNKLRQSSGLGMMECKKALEEANGDQEKASDILRVKYGARMAGRTDRANAEGRIAVAVSACGCKAALVQVNTETDFTANNDEYKAMAGKVAELALAQAKGEVAKTDAIEQAIEGLRIKTGENIQFKRGEVLEAGKVGTYVHFTGKVGVAIAVDGPADDALLKQLCMHISAAVPEPIAITEAEIPADVVAKEKAIAVEEAKATGKPEQIAVKIAEGKLSKFYDSVALLRQPFVMDDKKQVKAILPAGVTVKAFKKFIVN